MVSLFKEKLDKLFSMASDAKELSQSDFDKWFKRETIRSNLKKSIKTILSNSGYTLLSEEHFDYKDFDFLDELEFESLDDELDSDEFGKEASKLQDVIDKKKNLDYLTLFHSSDNDVDRRNMALENLVIANKKLVWKIVKKHNRFSTVSFDEDDMIQAGMQGLIKAAEKFEIDKGVQFSTYATWWIRQSITRGIQDFSTVIRVPVHTRENIMKYTKIQNQFWYENGRDGTDEELAEIIKIPLNDLIDLKRYRLLANITSLEAPIGTNEGSYFRDIIPDYKIESPEDFVKKSSLKEEFNRIFDEELTVREEKVLILRFGLDNGRKHTLEEIAQFEGVTRERIRQIEAKAIKKLQNPEVNKRLRDFYDD